MHHNSRLGGGDRFFNLKQHVLQKDGLLTIKASGWIDGTSHWSGHVSFSPTESDYDFWYWMACVRQPPEIVSERDLESWKREYAASRKELALAALAK